MGEQYIPKAFIKRAIKNQGVDRLSQEVVDYLAMDIDKRLERVGKELRGLQVKTGLKTIKLQHLKDISRR